MTVLGCGLIRSRRRGWLPPGYDPAHYLWTATPGYVYSDTAGTVLLTAAGNARSWRARNGTLAVFNANVAWDGSSKFTVAGTRVALATMSVPTTFTQVTVAEFTSNTDYQCVASTQTSWFFRVNRGTFSISLTEITPAFANLQMRGVGIVARDNTAIAARWNGEERAGNVASIAPGTSLNIGARAGGIDGLIGTLSAFYLIPNVAADATRRAALEASFAAEFKVTW